VEDLLQPFTHPPVGDDQAIQELVGGWRATIRSGRG
jgi:hypothetical protein